MGEEAIELLTKIGHDTSLRYAIQMIIAAALVSQKRKVLLSIFPPKSPKNFLSIDILYKIFPPKFHLLKISFQMIYYISNFPAKISSPKIFLSIDILYKIFPPKSIFPLKIKFSIIFPFD